MKTFTIVIKSKNKTSRDNFFLIFNKTILNKLYNIKKQFKKKTKKKKITILKSPHVNKKAQEQFETRVFSNQLTIRSIKIFKHFIFFKKLNFNLFSDIDIMLKYKIKERSTRKFYLKIFTPENFKFIKFLKSKNYNIKLKSLKEKNTFLKQMVHLKIDSLLQILDLYGEVFKYMFE